MNAGDATSINLKESIVREYCRGADAREAKYLRLGKVV